MHRSIAPSTLVYETERVSALHAWIVSTRRLWSRFSCARDLHHTRTSCPRPGYHAANTHLLRLDNELNSRADFLQTHAVEPRTTARVGNTLEHLPVEKCETGFKCMVYYLALLKGVGSGG